MPTLADIENAVYQLAPRHYAESWDNVGLQVGTPSASASRVLTAVEASPATVAAALDGGFQAVVCHHPLLFSPLKQLVTSDPVTRLALQLHAADIGLVVAHTNLDNSDSGPSAWLAHGLELHDCQPFPVSATEPQYKLVVFVPTAEVETVRDAMTAAGAGVIGNYTHCSFAGSGTGAFVPGRGANPTIGAVGELELVPECRLEMVVAADRLEAVRTAMVAAHPYEEVAHDVYALHGVGQVRGCGRVGRLSPPASVTEVVRAAAALTGSPCVRLAGLTDRTVEHVAVVAGSGGDFVEAAAAAGAEVLLTGDTKHHQAAAAELVGLTLIDIGHFESERSTAVVLKDHLEACFGDDLLVALFAEETSPYADPPLDN